MLVLALWTLSYFAAPAGVSMRWVVLAVAWGLAAPILGLTQQNLVTGDWHWTIQVLHLLIGAGAIGQGENLALRCGSSAHLESLNGRRCYVSFSSGRRSVSRSKSCHT